MTNISVKKPLRIGGTDNRAGEDNALERQIGNSLQLCVQFCAGGNPDMLLQELADLNLIRGELRIQLLDKAGNRPRDCFKRRNQLGNDQRHQQVNNQYQQNQHKHQRDGALGFSHSGHTVQHRQNVLFQKTHRHVQHKGNNCTQHKGRQNHPKALEETCQRIKALQ